MKTFAIGLAAAIVLASPAAAHHSYAMFEPTKTLTLQGTVKEMQWTNPHVWLEVIVSNGGAYAGNWSFEGANIAMLKRNGWDRNSVKVGDKLTIVTHPLRSGSKGGSLLSITLANGKTLTGAAITAAKTNPDLIEH